MKQATLNCAAGVAIKPDAGHAVLQRLIDSVAVECGMACWDYAAMYEVRDKLNSLQSIADEYDRLRRFHDAGDGDYHDFMRLLSREAGVE